MNHLRLLQPEGYRVERSEPVTIDLSENTNFEKTVNMVIPEDAVEGSPYAQVQVAGEYEVIIVLRKKTSF